MVPLEDKQKFLDELESLPIVSVVCKRTGISKATIYRWIEDDAGFKKNYTRALKRGRETLVDHAESKLVKMADREHFGAVKMILEANSKRYYRPRKAMPAPSRDLHTINLRVLGEKDVEVSVDTKHLVKNTEPPESSATDTADSASDSDTL
jgi:hypothetical protein